MRTIGFSTGALAKGDFIEGIRMQEGHVNAVELSALREDELDNLIAAMPKLNLSNFHYVSFHAPSRLNGLTERELVAQLKKITTYVSAIIIHPDIIDNPEEWRELEEILVIENMDQRKPGGRTAQELQLFFDQLPKARFCFDIGHARQIDPSLSVGVEMLQAFIGRLAEIHISEVDANSVHVPISSAAMLSYQRIASMIPKSIPVIIESIVQAKSIESELSIAKASLGDDRSLDC